MGDVCRIYLSQISASQGQSRHHLRSVLFHTFRSFLKEHVTNRYRRWVKSSKLQDILRSKGQTSVVDPSLRCIS